MIEFKIKTGLIEVTNNDKIFEGTMFEDMDFSVFFERLTRQETVDIMRKSKGYDITDEKDVEIMSAEIFSDLFLNKVKKWTGISNDGKELICSLANKKKLLDNDISSVFCSLCTIAFRTKIDEEEVIKKK